MELNSFENIIHTIRERQVILDSDLAIAYDVETKALNRAVKRNLERFPQDFMFQLTMTEFSNLRCQNGTSSYGGRRYMPYVFTEHGVIMLASLLKSETSVAVSIQIVNAFVSMRKFVLQNVNLFQRLDSIEKKHFLLETRTDERFDKVFNALQAYEPQQGIFYDGEVLAASVFITKLISRAKNRIILIDNYINAVTIDFSGIPASIAGNPS